MGRWKGSRWFYSADEKTDVGKVTKKWRTSVREGGLVPLCQAPGRIVFICSSTDPLSQADDTGFPVCKEARKLKKSRGLVPSHSDAGESRTLRGTQMR